MSFDKAIKYGKEKRKPYKGAKAVCCSCRNHGSCSWCMNNRLYSRKKAELKNDWNNQKILCPPWEDNNND